MRNKRSHDPLFKATKRKYTKRKQFEDDKVQLTEEIGDPVDESHYVNTIRFLQTFRVKNSSDKETVNKLMQEIEINRLQWIHRDLPSITEIFEMFPKYLDHIEIVI